MHKLNNVIILLLIETCATMEIKSISKSHICFSFILAVEWFEFFKGRFVKGQVYYRNITWEEICIKMENLSVLFSAPVYPLALLNTQMLPVAVL